MALTDEQLRIRRAGVTGTDIGVLLGLSPFSTPFDVWLEKRGDAPPREQTEDMERGTFLEDGARQWYAHRTGARVEQPGTVVSRRNPLVIATPDGVAHFPGDVRALEIKMPSSARDWGEPGTDAVPAYYLPQCHWELAALDMETADVFAVLEGKPRLYHVRRDVELEGLLIEMAERFWRDYVLAGKPPEVTAADLPSVSRWLKRHDTAEYLDFVALRPEAQATLEEYARAYHEQDAATERLNLWEARAKMVLGGAPGVRGLPEDTGWSRIDFTAQESGRVAWKRVAEALAKQNGVSPTQLSALVAENTGEGARPFTPRALRKRGT